jgi:rhodanese-related sulfurtransferase
MKRRGLIAAVATGAVVGMAGCTSLSGQSGSGGSSAPVEHPGTLETTFAANGDYPTDEDPADGLPPTFSESPPAPTADPSSFETINANGETVRLAPIDTVVAWYGRGEARFVDARGLDQYGRAHVYGSVVSPAQQGSTGGGIDGWPTDARIVTYCGCPHHLSSIRAAGLRKAGYSNIFALDEGFGAWSDAGYPMGGTAFMEDTTSRISEWRLDGTVRAGNAGRYAWAVGDRQYEAAPIRSDGSFTLHLKFADVSAATLIQVTTPDYVLTRPLGELAAGIIEG